MPQSLASVYIHVVFSTKNRARWLDRDIRSRLFPYVGGALRNVGCSATLIGGVKDHIHGLVSMSRTITVAKTIETMKTGSSRWMKENGAPGFEWQSGYGAFSVSANDLNGVIRYIEGQEDHHRKVTFEDELRALLLEARVEFDERYLWD